MTKITGKIYAQGSFQHETRLAMEIAKGKYMRVVLGPIVGSLEDRTIEVDGVIEKDEYGADYLKGSEYKIIQENQNA